MYNVNVIFTYAFLFFRKFAGMTPPSLPVLIPPGGFIASNDTKRIASVRLIIIILSLTVRLLYVIINVRKTYNKRTFKKGDTIMKQNEISISKGNRKMGAIPSVSLPPVVTCAAGCKCASKCYAAKLCRIYKNVRQAYARNFDILNSDQAAYFKQVLEYVKMQRFFRWHVSGDIVDGEYLLHMVSIAKLTPHCNFLAFTKQYGIVNEHIKTYGPLPENLQIIFSEWPGMDMSNPYNLPVAHVIFKGQEPAPDWKICGGNCTECACAGIGCWELKNSEHISFYEH